MPKPRSGADFVRRWPGVFGFDRDHVSTDELLARVTADAEREGSRVATAEHGRLTIVAGSPDWIADDHLFNEVATGHGHDVRAPVYLTAFASVIATQRRGHPVNKLVGRCTAEELEEITALASEHDRVVAFVC